MRENLESSASPIYLSTATLDAHGVSKRARAARVSSGELTRVCKGRFLHPDDDTPLRRLLACAGPGAAVSRATAAWLWGFDGYPSQHPLTVRVPMSSGARGRGTMRSRCPVDVALCQELPVTSVADTLLDIGASRSALDRWPSDADPILAVDRVELAVESALRGGLVSIAELYALLARSSTRRPGRHTLEAVLTRRPIGAPATESYLETRALQVIRLAGLPEPARQVDVRDRDGHVVARVDLLLGDIVIELDGHAFHGDASAFERDRRRWSELAALGYRVLVFTYDHVERNPEAVVRIIEHARNAGTLVRCA